MMVSMKHKSERGYVLTWTLILMLLSGLFIAPFLAFMMTGLRVAHSYADTMAEFYAADSAWRMPSIKYSWIIQKAHS